MFTSAQNWHDNNFTRLPGYRDRVVEIWHTPEEGGLNLDMPPKTIAKLTERGREAGRKLVERFATTPSSDALSWDGHRWARLRAGLEGLAKYLHGFKNSADHPAPGDSSLDELLAAREAAPRSPFAPDQLTEARTAINELRAYIARLESMPVCAGEERASRPFCNGPRPATEIGTRAPL